MYVFVNLGRWMSVCICDILLSAGTYYVLGGSKPLPAGTDHVLGRSDVLDGGVGELGSLLSVQRLVAYRVVVKVWRQVVHSVDVCV